MTLVQQVCVPRSAWSLLGNRGGQQVQHRTLMI